MMKRCLTLLFLLILLCTAICARELAYANTQNYVIASDGTIIKYLGNESSIIIPDQINGQEVSGINDEAFSIYGQSILASDPYILELELPATVKRIGQRAFYGQAELATVKLNEGLIKIEHGAFKDCRKLKSIVIPSTVEDMGGTIFAGTSIETIYFSGDCPSYIGSDTFSNFSYGEYIDFENLTIYYPAEYASSYGQLIEWYPNINWLTTRDATVGIEDGLPEENQTTITLEASLPAVEITYPANGSTIDTTDIQLKWKRVEGATYYVIHVRDITLGEDESKTNDFLLTHVDGWRIESISSQDEYIMNLSDVLEPGKYIETGKVYTIAINAFGPRYEDSWGVTKVTIAKPKLAVPQRILPVEQSGTIFDDAKDIMFKWTAVENATQYKVYIKDVTDVPSSEWNNPNTVAPSVYPEPDCVFVHDYYTIVDGTISLNVGATANFKDGHTYKACVMASDGGVHYEDSEGPVFFFSVGTELDIISDFNIHLTQENNSLTASAQHEAGANVSYEVLLEGETTTVASLIDSPILGTDSEIKAVAGGYYIDYSINGIWANNREATSSVSVDLSDMLIINAYRADGTDVQPSDENVYYYDSDSTFSFDSIWVSETMSLVWLLEPGTDTIFLYSAEYPDMPLASLNVTVNNCIYHKGSYYEVVIPEYNADIGSNNAELDGWKTIDTIVLANEVTFDWAGFLAGVELEGTPSAEEAVAAGQTYVEVPRFTASGGTYKMAAGSDSWTRSGVAFGIQLFEDILANHHSTKIRVLFQQKGGEKRAVIELGNESIPYRANMGRRSLTLAITEAYTWWGAGDKADELIRKIWPTDGTLKSDYKYDMYLDYDRDWSNDFFYAYIAQDAAGNWQMVMKIKEDDEMSVIGGAGWFSSKTNHIINVKPYLLEPLQLDDSIVELLENALKKQFQ